MRHWKIIGAILAILAEGALQVSGFTCMPLAIILAVICVGLFLWSAYPMLKRIRLQSPFKTVGEDKQVDTKLKTDSISAFYSTRISMGLKYGGIKNELTKANKIWATCHGATVFAHEPSELLKKVEKLILIDPESQSIEECRNEAEPPANINDIRSDIIRATESFQKIGTKVKWFNGLFNLFTILDPDTEKARARVEIWVYNEANKRQNYIIDKQTNKEAYDGIVDTFNRMWNDKLLARDPPDTISLRMKLGLYTRDFPKKLT